jgi:hypothetical protein
MAPKVLNSIDRLRWFLVVTELSEGFGFPHQDLELTD